MTKKNRRYAPFKDLRCQRPGPLGGAWNIYELLPAFIVAILVNVAVSLATKEPEKAVTDVFDEMKAM